MAEQNQNPLVNRDQAEVSKRWLVRSWIWIWRALMSRDRMLEDAAEFERRLRDGSEKLSTPAEDAQWAKETRDGLAALSQKFEEQLKK
jgi:hypothetical protein